MYLLMAKIMKRTSKRIWIYNLDNEEDKKMFFQRHTINNSESQSLIDAINGYVKDIQYLMSKFKEFLVVSADLPFLRSKLIKNILIKYKEIMQPISVVIAIEKYEKMGFTPSITVNSSYVPIGVNIVTDGKDYFYKVEGKQTININTKKELEMIMNERTSKAI